jgi:hypothetical protein
MRIIIYLFKRQLLSFSENELFGMGGDIRFCGQKQTIIVLYFYIIKDKLILHIVIFKIYFFLIYVLFNDTHLQLIQQP